MKIEVYSNDDAVAKKLLSWWRRRRELRSLLPAPLSWPSLADALRDS